MYSQFIHIQCYGVTPRADRPSWSCVDGIAEEGARVPQASRHVPYRAEPKILYGTTPLEAKRLAKENAPRAKDAKGRKLRCDGAVFAAGVVSYPVPKAEIASDPVDQDIYSNWKYLTIEFLKACFGEHLISVVEHTDEQFFHLHFYLVPKLQSDCRLNWPDFHPGRAMKAAAAEAGACKRDEDAAYRSGMARFQDDFHYAVSRFFGHMRYGSKKMRLSRLEHKMRKKIEDDSAREQSELKIRAAELDLTEEKLVQREASLDSTVRRHVEANEWLKSKLSEERACRQRLEAELKKLRGRLMALEGAEAAAGLGCMSPAA